MARWGLQTSIFLLSLGVYACTFNTSSNADILPSDSPADVPVVVSTSMPTPIAVEHDPTEISASPPITLPTAINNPAFEKLINLGVPVGNADSPQYLALNSQDQQLYIFSNGVPILKQGNIISIFDMSTGQFTAQTSINQGSPYPVDLQFDSETGFIYALWKPEFGTDQPRTLSVVDSQTLEVLQEIPHVDAFAAANGKLYIVGQDKLAKWSREDNLFTEVGQVDLSATSWQGPMAVDTVSNQLYMSRADDEGVMLEIFSTDTLALVNTYLPVEPVLNIFPNPAAAEVLVIKGDTRDRILQRLSPDGREIAPPHPLGSYLSTSAAALSGPGDLLYYNSGQLRPSDPQPDDITGPALMGLNTSDFTASHRVPLLNNFADIVINDETRQAFALYPYDDALYIIELDTGFAHTVYTAIRFIDAVIDEAGRYMYVADTAQRIRRFDAETFEPLAEILLDSFFEDREEPVRIRLEELALDENHNRLYVSGNPAFVLDTETLTEIDILESGGQFAPDPQLDNVYLSDCGVTVLNADTLTGDTVLPGSGPRDDQFVPNPCVSRSYLDSNNQFLYSIVPNGTPGSNSGNYLYVYNLDGPTMIFSDTNISINQALPDSAAVRAFIGHSRVTFQQLRTLSPATDYTHRLLSANGYTVYSPTTNRVYFSDGDRLMALNAATFSVIGEMPLPTNYGYRVVAMNPANEQVFLTGYNGQMLLAQGNGAASRTENLQALQQAGFAAPPASVPTGTMMQLESTANNHLIARINAQADGYGPPRLFLSTDNGKTWQSLNETLPPFTTQTVAVSPHYAQDATLYAGVSSGNTGGLYQSVDGGQSWNIRMNGMRDLRVSNLFLSPNFGTQSGLIFADTTYTGLHVSTDGGQQWTPVVEMDFDDDLSKGGVAAISSQDTVLISQSLEKMEGVFRATVDTDGNLSAWQKVLNLPLNLLAFSPDGKTVLGFGRNFDSALWRSADGGFTWQPGGQGLTDLDSYQANRILFSPNFATDQTAYFFFTNIRGDESGRLHRSTDGGQTWQPWQRAPGNKLITAVALAANGDFLLGDTQSQVSRVSPNALSWQEPELPVESFPLDDLVVSPQYATDKTLFAVNHAHGLFKSGDGGQQWQLTEFPVRSTSFEGYRLAISPDFAQDQTLYAATGFSLHRSTDGGERWQNLVTQTLNIPAEAVALSPEFAKDDTLLVSTPAGLWRSTDRGQSWHTVLVRTKKSASARVLTFSPLGQVAYVWFDYDNTLYISTDNGETWQARPGRPDDYFSVAASAVTSDVFTLAPNFPLYLLQTSDQGQQWTTLESLPQDLVNVNTMAYASTGELLIGGPGGIFVSDDNGQSWQAHNNNLPSESEVALLRLVEGYQFITLADGKILVSSDGKGAWQDISIVP